jgi:beta-glucanase (GH16 family)
MKGATVKKSLFVMSILLALGALALAQDRAVPDPDTRPTKIWNRTGPLGDTPQHVSDAHPLSDQENKGGWMKFEPMSDEFDGQELDLNKWNRGLYWWKGRQPALFRDRNVTVSDGKLHLTMRKEKVPEQFEKLGYKDYTSAALHSKARSSYGYYEVKAKPMNSGGSSSFWFQVEDVPGWLTEIDVFEIGGNAKGFERKYNMNVHVFRTPKEQKHWSVGGVWVAPWRLADDYRVYGLEWTPEEIRYYVDGVLVRTVENTHWHQPLFMIFDSETMPKWFGMPADDDLPSTYSVEYVRAWKSSTQPDFSKLKEGMTLDQAREILGSTGRLRENSPPGEATYDFDFDGKSAMLVVDDEATPAVVTKVIIWKHGKTVKEVAAERERSWSEWVEAHSPKERTKTSMKGWELYIWQDGGDTYFSLMVGTNRLKSDDEIARTAVKGLDAIKPKLDQLKQGQYVFVHARRLAAPAPDNRAKAIAEYCRKIGLQVQP